MVHSEFGFSCLWFQTACDMVKFFYATKSEIKYKLTFPKVKKKVAKAYKPAPLPDFREMYDQASPLSLDSH